MLSLPRIELIRIRRRPLTPTRALHLHLERGARPSDYLHADDRIGAPGGVGGLTEGIPQGGRAEPRPEVGHRGEVEDQGPGGGG